MRLERIAHVDFGDISISAERAGSTVGLRQRHHEIVNALEAAFVLLPRGQRHDDGRLAPRRHRRSLRHWLRTASTPTTASAGYPEILQLCGSKITGANASEISCHGMTARASRSEKSFARRGVADKHIELERFGRRWRRPLSRSRRQHAMNVGGERLHI